MGAFYERITALFTIDLFYRLGVGALRIVALLLATWLVLRIARRALPRVLRAIGRRMAARDDEDEGERIKRAETLGGMIMSVVVVVVWMVSILMILR